jgi:hypothetical protein
MRYKRDYFSHASSVISLFLPSEYTHFIPGKIQLHATNLYAVLISNKHISCFDFIDKMLVTVCTVLIQQMSLDSTIEIWLRRATVICNWRSNCYKHDRHAK